MPNATAKMPTYWMILTAVGSAEAAIKIARYTSPVYPQAPAAARRRPAHLLVLVQTRPHRRRAPTEQELLMGKSSRRNKEAKPKRPRIQFVDRPFEGLPFEAELVAMREIIPAATLTVITTPEYGLSLIHI